MPQVVLEKFYHTPVFQRVPDLCSCLVTGHIEDTTQAWNNIEEAEEENAHIKLWLLNLETDIKMENVAKQAIPGPILRDASNFSRCLGGTQFSSTSDYVARWTEPLNPVQAIRGMYWTMGTVKYSQIDSGDGDV